MGDGTRTQHVEAHVFLSRYPCRRQVHASNALGGVNPVSEIAEAAHAVGAKVLVDGCQSVPNMPVDVQVRSFAHTDDAPFIGLVPDHGRL